MSQPLKHLTEPMKRFAEFRLRGLDNYTAYVTAYPEAVNLTKKTVMSKASRLFNEKIVAEYYKSLENLVVKEVIKEVTIDKALVVSELTEAMRKCLGKEDVEEISKDLLSGEEVVVSHTKKRVFQPKVANEIAANICKILGLNEEKGNTEVQQVVIIDDLG